MSDLIREFLPIIIAGGGTCLTALLGALASFFYARKTKYDAIAKENELSIENAKLQQDKIELQSSIYKGTYILCPNCNEKIFLKDMKFKIDTEVKENA